MLKVDEIQSGKIMVKMMRVLGIQKLSPPGVFMIDIQSMFSAVHNLSDERGIRYVEYVTKFNHHNKNFF